MTEQTSDLPTGYTDGDVNHNVQPVIGWMRLLIHDGKAMTADKMESAVTKLRAACDAENALLRERAAAARSLVGAPTVAVLSHGSTRPETISSADWRSWGIAVPVYVWNTLRRATRRDSVAVSVAEMTERIATPPTGYLYTPSGAHNLDDVLAAMWTCPEAMALRDVPHTSEQYRDPHLATQEQAQYAMNDLWAEFLAAAGVVLTAQEKA